MSMMRDRAGRAPVAARQVQAAGRHERRPHLVEATRAGGHPTPMTDASRPDRATQAVEVRATRAARSRHAAPAGWAEWAARGRRFAGLARAWWAEGTDRVAARASERWADQVAGPRQTPSRAGRASSDPAPGGRATLTSVDTDPTALRPRHLAAQRQHRGEDLVTGWCSALVVLGLYLDGWNHAGLRGDAGRPFLTPWHAVLYAAFAGTAAWILAQGRIPAQARRGAWSLRAVPAGYRLALVGIGLAIVAVVGDAVWHVLFGEAQGLARLVAPFHLVLLAGACLLVTWPLRAAWSGPSSARVPGLAAFWPVLASTTLVVATTAWFFQQASPATAPPPPAPTEALQVEGLLGLLAQNLLFVAPVLLLLLRWQTPLGTFTVMAGSVSLLLATQTDLGLAGLTGAAVLGGAAADVAVTLLRPSPHRRWAARAVGVIAPAVYWTAHFALLGAGYGASLEPPAVAASVLWASLSGLSLALLMWPPAVPLTAWNRGRSPARQATRSTARSPATPAPMPARMLGR